MNGLNADATDTPRATVVSRLWGWFELLPFRRGVTLLALLIVVPALLVGGLLIVRGGGNGDPPRSQAVAATPSVRDHDSGTVERAERTWGKIVASHSAQATPKSGATASASPRATPSTSSRPRRTPIPSSSGTKCPPELKKWPWMWDLCKHRHGGHGRP
ncbi:hypothetical protein NE236_17700 [Actinoallomurus purpureus]|uniref:hypothetical protein n=1 Tax=Actinoallomurus purpureus TaxID=478114 RepID=UPI0020938D24|nr:hypothetical protein [Actinoallomurus purpureus]MCO6006823.1 hypothetical protein [Actinoallomurus purpureus]